ncbi:MAG: hypothetical protein RIT81_41015 [Deltaproteobacteria bacterium]
MTNIPNIPLILAKAYVDGQVEGYEQRQAQQQAVADAAAAAGEPCLVEVCERTAGLPGGDFASKNLEMRHWWIKTPNLESGQGKVGGGVPAQGDPQPWTLETQFNDHTGEAANADVCTPVCGVDVADVEEAAAIGRPTGVWVPGLNDCNNQVTDALRDAGAPETNIPKAPFHHDWAHDLFQSIMGDPPMPERATPAPEDEMSDG